MSIDFAEIVRDAAADADFEAQAKGKFVEVSSADSCMVMGSENLLRSAVENVLRNAVRYTAERTVVNVSHRLGNLTELDTIVVIDAGQVIDMGPHADLLGRCELYRNLWFTQNPHLRS